MRDKIAAAVNANELRGLLPDVEACLQLKPNQDDLTKLKDDLLQREAQIDARNQQIIAQAQQLMQQLQFDAVQQILNQLALEDQTDATNGLLRQARHINLQRQYVLSSVPTALSQKKYQVVIQGITEYLNELSNAGLQDPQLQQMLDEAKAKESASIRNKKLKKLVKLVIAAACVVVLIFWIYKFLNYIDTQNAAKLIINFGVAAGIFLMVFFLSIIRTLNNHDALKTAIAEGDWQTALELYPGDADGLRLKTDAIHDALSKGAWLTVLEIDPFNRAALLHAKIHDALSEGDWQTALELDPNNTRALDLRSKSNNIK